MDIPHIEGFDITAWVRDNSAGSLWRARQRRLDRTVQLLVVDRGADPARRDALLEAARLAARTRQPGLAGVLDAAIAPDGAAYVVMEAFEGESLLDRLAASGPFPADRLAAVARGVAGILSRAWAAVRYVHRNLKPEDVQLGPDGTVRIASFASGTCVGPDGLVADRSGDVVGTPSYMAPEQARADPALDFHADMYGLGALLHHLATGRRPFEDFLGDPMRLLASLDTAELPPVRSLRPDLDAGLAAVIDRLLRKDPRDRYPSWDALLLALGVPVPAHPSAPAFPAPADAAMAPAPAPSDEAPAPPPAPAPAAHGSRVPGILWLLLAVAIAALGLWRWRHPDVPPTVETIAARWRAFRAERAAPPPAVSAPAPIPEDRSRP